MFETLLQYKTAVVTSAIFLFLLLENLWPYATSPFVGKGKWHRWGRNLSLFALNMPASLFIVIPVTFMASTVGPNWRDTMAVDFWQQDWVILIDIILLDLFIYGWHRINHKIPLLWRFHEVHHLDEFLDVTSAIRFHFGEVILSSFVRGAIIIGADIPLLSVVIFEMIVMICSIFQHSNVAIPAKFSQIISYFIVTPDWHWQHHHARREDTDSHYGTMLTLWDRLFNSRAKGQRTENMHIGVEGRKEKDLKGLILRPLDKT